MITSKQLAEVLATLPNYAIVNGSIESGKVVITYDDPSFDGKGRGLSSRKVAWTKQARKWSCFCWSI